MGESLDTIRQLILDTGLVAGSFLGLVLLAAQIGSRSLGSRSESGEVIEVGRKFVETGRAIVCGSGSACRSERETRPNPGPRLSLVDWSASLTIAVAAGIAKGARVPAGNELIYLPLVRSHVDPTYLANDWTLGTGFREHYAFSALLGPVVDAIGMEALAWADE